MASREERMQQRLRGAQRRQVKDVDFGLVFPAAQLGPDVPHTQISPHPDPPQIEPPQQIPSRRASAHVQPSNTAPSADIISPASHSTFDANTSAKRRKLGSDVSSSRSTRSQRLPRPDVYALENDQQDETVLHMLLDSTNDSIPTRSVAIPTISQPAITSTPATRIRARTPPVSLEVVDEVIESPGELPGSSRRIRRSIGEGARRSSRSEHVNDESIIQAGSASPISSEKELAEAHAKNMYVVRALLQNKRNGRNPNTRNSLRTSKTPQKSSGSQDDSLQLDELSPEQPNLSKSTITGASNTDSVGEGPSGAGLDDNEEAEAIEDEQAAAILERNRGRRFSKAIPADPFDENDLMPLSISKKRKGRHRLNSTPALQRQPKQAASNSNPARTAKKGHIESPIPVTVHRFTNPLVYNDEEEDADILNSEIPMTRRRGVNTIDVLMEVSGEIVGAAMQTLDDGGRTCEDAALRREYKTKWQAVAAFSRELETRLLEHTVSLDNVYSLERRLREEQKKKLRLREEILRIRAERTQISLHMDEVRVKHEAGKTKAQVDTSLISSLSLGLWRSLRIYANAHLQVQDSLNSNVHDIELAIDLGKERQLSGTPGMFGTEVLLKRVAGEVSNKGDSGGLLRQVKSFNAFLERVALVLEASKVGESRRFGG